MSLLHRAKRRFLLICLIMSAILMTLSWHLLRQPYDTTMIKATKLNIEEVEVLRSQLLAKKNDTNKLGNYSETKILNKESVSLELFKRDNNPGPAVPKSLKDVLLTVSEMIKTSGHGFNKDEQKFIAILKQQLDNLPLYSELNHSLKETSTQYADVKSWQKYKSLTHNIHKTLNDTHKIINNISTSTKLTNGRVHKIINNISTSTKLTNGRVHSLYGHQRREKLIIGNPTSHPSKETHIRHLSDIDIRDLQKTWNNMKLNLKDANNPVNLRDSNNPDNLRDANNPVNLRDANNPVNFRDTNNPVNLRDANNPMILRDANNPVDLRDTNNPVNLRDANNLVNFRDTNNPMILRDANNTMILRDANNQVIPTVSDTYTPQMFDDEPGTYRPDYCRSCFSYEFPLIINQPKLCRSKDKVHLLMFISSAPGNREARVVIRNTWAARCQEHHSELKCVFVVGRSEDDSENFNVKTENKTYGDILQIDFKDSYGNLTYKTVTSLRWAAKYCGKAKYVMKTDDDMYVNTELIPKMLLAAPSDNFVGGYCWGSSNPNRDFSSKWFVSFKMYRKQKFPPMCSGTGYVMSMDVVRKVLVASHNVPFFHLEDVYVSMCLQRFGIMPNNILGFSNMFTEFDACQYRNSVFTSHQFPSKMLEDFWPVIQDCPQNFVSPANLFIVIPYPFLE